MPARKTTIAAAKSVPAALFEVTLEFSRSTKGTHVYNDESDDAPVRSLYVSKSALEDPPPQTITVTARDAS